MKIQVTPENVKLVRTKSRTKDGEAWRIIANGVNAGIAYIDYDIDPLIGRKPTALVFLKAKSKDKGIKGTAYTKACNESKHDRIYAIRQKGNTEAMEFLKRAGFKVISTKDHKTIVLLFTKQR